MICIDEIFWVQTVNSYAFTYRAENKAAEHWVYLERQS